MQVAATDIQQSARYWTGRLARGLRYHDKQDLESFLTLQLVMASRRFNIDKSSWKVYSGIVARGAVKDFFSDEYYASDIPVEELLDSPAYDDTSYIHVREFAEQYTGNRKSLVICMALGYNDSEIARVLATTPQLVRRMRLDLLRGLLQGN